MSVDPMISYPVTSRMFCTPFQWPQQHQSSPQQNQHWRHQYPSWPGNCSCWGGFCYVIMLLTRMLHWELNLRGKSTEELLNCTTYFLMAYFTCIATYDACLWLSEAYGCIYNLLGRRHCLESHPLLHQKTPRAHKRGCREDSEEQSVLR